MPQPVSAVVLVVTQKRPQPVLAVVLVVINNDPTRFGGRSGRFIERPPPFLAVVMAVLKKTLTRFGGRSGSSKKPPPPVLAVFMNKLQWLLRGEQLHVVHARSFLDIIPRTLLATSYRILNLTIYVSPK
jgi:hypothetical protein